MPNSFTCEGLTFILVNNICPSYELNLTNANFAITMKDDKWIATRVYQQTAGTIWIYPEEILKGDTPWECAHGVAKYIIKQLKEKK